MLRDDLPEMRGAGVRGVFHGNVVGLEPAH
jgi:hypothetical protein